MHTKKKRKVTLIEMMIVMFLIALIIGIVSYNYTGTLEKGKAFKTQIGMEKLRTILSLHASEYPDSLNDMPGKWQDYVRQSTLVQDPRALTVDGWGNPYQVTVENNEIKVRSEKFEEYEKKTGGSH